MSGSLRSITSRVHGKLKQKAEAKFASLSRLASQDSGKICPVTAPTGETHKNYEEEEEDNDDNFDNFDGTEPKGRGGFLHAVTMLSRIQAQKQFGNSNPELMVGLEVEDEEGEEEEKQGPLVMHKTSLSSLPDVPLRFGNYYGSGSGSRSGINRYECLDNEARLPKTIMMAVNSSEQSRTALVWTLSNLVTDRDTLLLLHVTEPAKTKPLSASPKLNSANFNLSFFMESLKATCRSYKPKTQVKAVVARGDNTAVTIVDCARSWDTSVIVLGQKKPSMLKRILKIRKEQDLVDYCIQNAHCLAMAIGKQKSSMGGYLVTTKWHRNFWLLA